MAIIMIFDYGPMDLNKSQGLGLHYMLRRLKSVVETMSELDEFIGCTPRSSWESRSKVARREEVRTRNRLLASICDEDRLVEVGRLEFALSHTYDNVVGGGEFVDDPEF